MNGIDYFADTNALIYLLNGNPCMQDFLHSSLAVSVISELEILSFSDITEQLAKLSFMRRKFGFMR